MKTVFLKDVIPFAVIALGISGAFATTSMQSASKISAPQQGYILDSNGACNLPVTCSDVPGAVCRMDETGPQAFGKDNLENCTEILYQP